MGFFLLLIPLLLWLQRIVTSVRWFVLCVHVKVLGIMCTHSTNNETELTIETQERRRHKGRDPNIVISKLYVVYCTELA